MGGVWCLISSGDETETITGLVSLSIKVKAHSCVVPGGRDVDNALTWSNKWHGKKALLGASHKSASQYHVVRVSDVESSVQMSRWLFH